MAGKSEESRKSRILAALEDQDTSIVIDDPLENEMILNMGHSIQQRTACCAFSCVWMAKQWLRPFLNSATSIVGTRRLRELHVHEFIPHTDRLDYLSPISNNVAFVLAVEKLLASKCRRGEVHPGALLRNGPHRFHLVAIGSMAMDVGALTVLLWTFREREKILDIYDVLTGARFTTSYTRVGDYRKTGLRSARKC